MFVSDDAGLIDHARKLTIQAQDPAPHDQHSEIGYNYRLSNILAGVGRGQLRVLGQRVAAKRRIFDLSPPKGLTSIRGPYHQHFNSYSEPKEKALSSPGAANSTL